MFYYLNSSPYGKTSSLYYKQSSPHYKNISFLNRLIIKIVIKKNVLFGKKNPPPHLVVLVVALVVEKVYFSSTRTFFVDEFDESNDEIHPEIPIFSFHTQKHIKYAHYGLYCSANFNIFKY